MIKCINQVQKKVHTCFHKERRTGLKDPLKEKSMPSTEGKHELAKSWERSETGLHPPNLVNQKNSYNSCSSDERRNWFYGCLSSMDSTSTEVESSLDLNVLLSKMRNNLTFGMDTQINNSILYP